MQLSVSKKEGFMTKATKIKQLSFDMPDKPGLLSEVTGAIRAAKATISSICAYAMDGKAFFMVITDSNAQTKKALAKLGAKSVKEEDVVAVEVPNKAGELDKVAKKLADANIDIYYLFGSAASGKTAAVILSSSDNKKVIKVISK